MERMRDGGWTRRVCRERSRDGREAGRCAAAKMERNAAAKWKSRGS